MKIRFLIAICYNVLDGNYSKLLNNILKDKNKISENNDPELTGFNEFYALISVVQLEMAMYNIDNADHTYRFTDFEEIVTMKEIIETKYNDLVSVLK